MYCKLGLLRLLVPPYRFSWVEYCLDKPGFLFRGTRKTSFPNWLELYNKPVCTSYGLGWCIAAVRWKQGFGHYFSRVSMYSVVIKKCYTKSLTVVLNKNMITIILTCLLFRGLNLYCNWCLLMDGCLLDHFYYYDCRYITCLEETQASQVLQKCDWTISGLWSCVGLLKNICWDTANISFANTGT